METRDDLVLACSTAGEGASGIYGYAFDAERGVLRDEVRTPVDHPMFLALGPDGEFAYAANRTGGGEVTSFALDRATGALERLNGQSSEGGGPCYVSVDGAGRFAFVANYDAGTVAMLPIGAGGELDPACDVVQHEGGGPNPDRQAAPHPHAIVPGPDDRFAYVPDLGTDRVAIYRIDADAGRLRPADPPGVDLPPGAGPRHLAFGPDGARAYVVGELDATLTALRRDADTGALRRTDSASTLPGDADDGSSPADVHVHPSGRWVYASNRGHDSIAAFAVDGGSLRRVGLAPTGGRRPRDFALDPAGAHVLAANRDTDTVVSLATDDEGGLSRVAASPVPKPTHLAVLRRE